MKLSRVGGFSKSRFKLINGYTFYGQILDIPDTSRVSNFLSARRYLRTSPNTRISAGDVLVLSGVPEYIIAEHGDGFFKDPIYTHYKMFAVDEILPVTRKVDTINPITGVKEKTSESLVATGYFSVQPDSDGEDDFKIPLVNKTLVSNVPLKLNDRVGSDWVVTEVDSVLGLYVAKVKTK